MALKAIETQYNGYRFRSRLEARWAVFFDQLGLPYVYEPEGFNLDGVHYLPDFQLPRGLESCPCPDLNDPHLSPRPVWVEIKPQQSTMPAVVDDKASRLAQASDTTVCVFSGDPYVGAYTATIWRRNGERATPIEPWSWSECPVCGTVDLQRRAGIYGDSLEEDGRYCPMFQCMHCDIHDRSWCDNATDYYWHKGFWIVLRRGWQATQGPKLNKAFLAARGARFEHGESGPLR